MISTYVHPAFRIFAMKKPHERSSLMISIIIFLCILFSQERVSLPADAGRPRCEIFFFTHLRRLVHVFPITCQYSFGSSFVLSWKTSSLAHVSGGDVSIQS